MRVVIDTNSLQSHELRIFLSADRANVAILPEHTIVEVFKQNTLDQVYLSFEVISAFPNQIAILRSNRHVADTDVRYPGFANRFFDRSAIRGLPKFIQMLASAKAGDVRLQAQLGERRKWALERIDKGMLAFGDASEELATLRSQFNRSDLAALSRNERTSHEFKVLLFDLTTSFANDLWRQRTSKFLSPGNSRFNDFTWRYVLCHLLRLLYLTADGGVRRKPMKLINDHFDNVFAAYGTYYNGLMTNDVDAQRTYLVARTVLEFLGGRVPEDYIGGGYILEAIERYEVHAPGVVGGETERVSVAEDAAKLL